MTLQELADDYAEAYSHFILCGDETSNKACLARDEALHLGIASAISAEREACAKIAEQHEEGPGGAEAIRKRSNEQN